ncbi:MAG: M23 family metallopeptidase [Bacteroidales bacterium]|nr:M23 family metallopeptidase [Bacteroidales bacterium]
MKLRQYLYDSRTMRYRKAGFDFLGLLAGVFKVVLVSLSLFIVAYFILAAFLSTDAEKRLSREIRAYERLWPALQEREAMLGESIRALETKDDGIYRIVFRNDAPNVDPIGTMDIFFGADTVSENGIVDYTSAKTARLTRQAAMVEDAFEKIYSTLAEKGGDIPPMSLPVKDISYPQIGASVGSRRNPILGADVRHNGLDFIVPRGTPVYAPADGMVEKVRQGSKGDGNVVVLSHPGGYTTRFCHLSEMKVKDGQKVRKGQVIGTTGMSGDAFAPHLHYEVLLEGRPLNPANCIFASVSPEEYSNMLYMSVYTKESMD